MARYDLHLLQNDAALGEEFEQRTVLMSKGVLITANASNSPVPVTVGTDGYVLVADGGETGGIKWDTIDNIMSYPISVENGGTGLTEVGNNYILTGNVAGNLTAESTLQGSASLFKVLDGTLELRMTASTATCYVYSIDTAYKDIVLGSAVTSAGVYVDQTNDRVGIWQDTPLQRLHVGGSIQADGNLVLTSGATRTISVSGTSGNHIAVTGGDGGTTGGNVYVTGGNGSSTDGDIYIGKNTSGVVQANAVYVSPVFTSDAGEGDAFVLIDTDGKLKKHAVPSVSATEYLTIDASGDINSTSIPSTYSEVMEIFRGDTTKVYLSSAITLLDTYNITNAAYEALDGSCIKITIALTRSLASTFGDDGSFYLYVRLDNEDLIIFYTGAGSDGSFAEAIYEIWLFPMGSTWTRAIGTCTVGYETGSDHESYAVVNRAYGVNDGRATHGTGDNINIYYKDSETDNTVKLNVFMVEILNGP